MLIEDDQNTQILTQRQVEQAVDKCWKGTVEMDVASTWEEGDDMARTGLYDVVLLDLSLPPYSRDDVLIKMGQVAHEWPPIVVFTGHKEDELRRRAIALGASSFFLKCIAAQSPDALMQSTYNAFLRRRYANGFKTTP